MGTTSRRVVMSLAIPGALIAIAHPSAWAAPATDDRGYVDSSARCTAPSTVVIFGSTDNSRIAICKTSDGAYEYRGVRVSDGAKLVAPAKPSGDSTFVAESGGILYLFSPKSLIVSQDTKVLREEPIVDFHGPGAPAPTTPTSTTPLPPPLAAEAGPATSSTVPPPG
jgi:hypothetical protein